MINAMLILENLEDTEVMQVQVKDFAMFKESHDLWWPQVIASTTVVVKQEVDGYLELTPIKWLALNGPPVIRMKVCWSKIGAGLPTPGSTSHLMDAWQPLPEPASENTDMTQSVNNQAMCEVPDQSDPTASSGAGVPASSGDPVPRPTMFSNSSSVFHIDPAVFDLAKPNDFLRTLLRMQEKGGSVHPFPATAGRDYSCLGAGFDTTTGEHVTLWGPIDDPAMPKGLEEVHKAMETFAVKGQANPHWCSGVLVLPAWLKTLKEDSSS